MLNWLHCFVKSQYDPRRTWGFYSGNNVLIFFFSVEYFWIIRWMHLWTGEKFIFQSFIILTGLPRRFSGKESTYQCRRFRICMFDPWLSKIPWRRKWQPAPVFLPGKFHEYRSLVGYSPWGHKELDMSAQLRT